MLNNTELKEVAITIDKLKKYYSKYNLSKKEVRQLSKSIMFRDSLINSLSLNDSLITNMLKSERDTTRMIRKHLFKINNDLKKQEQRSKHFRDQRNLVGILGILLVILLAL